MQDVPEIDRLNEEIAGWARMQTRKMVQAVASLTLKDKHALRKAAWNAAKDPNYKPLEKSIGFGLKRDFGQVSRVNFRMARHGIFFERGVGRSRKVNSANTRPHPFIKPILDPAIDELATIIAEGYADVVQGEIKFNLPGIIARRVKIVTQNG